MVCELESPPIHLTRVTRPPSNEEFSHYLAYMTQVLSLNQQFAIVVDASIDGPALSQAHLRSIASWISTHRAALKSYCIGYALVRRSIPVPVRFATAMMLSILPIIPMPYRMFGNRQEALAWVGRLLQASPSPHDKQSKAWSEPPQ